MTSRFTAASQEAPRPWAFVLVGLITVAMMFATLLVPASTFDTLIGEDGPVETLGAIGLGIAVVFAALALLREKRGGAHWFKQVSYFGLAVFFFLSAGEEISWGQRILGFGTPEKVNRVNAQGEFNVHNLTGLGDAPELVFFAVWVSLVVIIPLAVALGGRLARRLREFVPVLPPAFIPLFLGTYLLSKIAQAIFDGRASYESIYPVAHAVTEIKEAAVELLLGFVLWWLWRYGDWGRHSDLQPAADAAGRTSSPSARSRS